MVTQRHITLFHRRSNGSQEKQQKICSTFTMNLTTGSTNKDEEETTEYDKEKMK